MPSIDIVDIVLTQKDSGLDFFERFWEDPPQALDKKSSEFSDRGIVDGTLDMNAMNMLWMSMLMCFNPCYSYSFNGSALLAYENLSHLWFSMVDVLIVT